MARPGDATVHLIRGWGEGQNASLGAPPNAIPEQNDARSFRSASARFFPGSSATQSGASSVGPSEHFGGKSAALSLAEGPAWRQGARRPPHIGASRPG